MRCIAYHPPIAVSLILLALPLSYFKQTLRHWGQLLPYIRMGSLGTCMHLDCNAMSDVAKISPRVPSTCAHNPILSLLIIHIIPSRQSCVAIDNPILSLLIIHIIPSRQSYVVIDNPSLVPSVSCHTTSSYLWNYVHSADDVSNTENLQSNRCRCFSHLYKF
jgi:hypothetical protein